MEKTLVMKILDQKKILYSPHYYDSTLTDGVSVANAINENVDAVFKTLVTMSNNSNYFVFVIPVSDSLDLKKAARTCGAKKIEMLKQKDLLNLTGYIHGGCSPIGMKKLFPTYIHSTAGSLSTMFVSAGKIGTQIEINPSDLINIVKAQFADLVVS